MENVHEVTLESVLEVATNFFVSKSISQEIIKNLKTPDDIEKYIWTSNHNAVSYAKAEGKLEVLEAIFQYRQGHKETEEALDIQSNLTELLKVIETDIFKSKYIAINSRTSILKPIYFLRETLRKNKGNTEDELMNIKRSVLAVMAAVERYNLRERFYPIFMRYSETLNKLKINLSEA